MSERRNLPDLNRLSILAASILLAYALTRFIDLPSRDVSIQLPGIYLSFQINIRTVISFLVAGLTASGADWLLQQHPESSNHTTIEHWLLPAMTAWVIGIPLYQLSPGPQWWVGYAIGGALLMAVLLAEYITIDPQDVRHPAASAGLTAVSFALFLTLAITLRYAGLRLFLLLPTLVIASALVSLRTLHLRLERWAFIEAGTIALVCGQLAAALHYFPLTPIAYGLLLLGPVYALTSLIANLANHRPLRQALIEPAIVLSLVLGTALWVG